MWNREQAYVELSQKGWGSKHTQRLKDACRYAVCYGFCWKMIQ
jgi:hypothetical protein